MKNFCNFSDRVQKNIDGHYAQDAPEVRYIRDVIHPALEEDACFEKGGFFPEAKKRHRNFCAKRGRDLKNLDVVEIFRATQDAVEDLQAFGFDVREEIADHGISYMAGRVEMALRFREMHAHLKTLDDKENASENA